MYSISEYVCLFLRQFLEIESLETSPTPSKEVTKYTLLRPMDASVAETHSLHKLTDPHSGWAELIVHLRLFTEKQKKEFKTVLFTFIFNVHF